MRRRLEINLGESKSIPGAVTLDFILLEKFSCFSIHAYITSLPYRSATRKLCWNRFISNHAWKVSNRSSVKSAGDLVIFKPVMFFSDLSESAKLRATTCCLQNVKTTISTGNMKISCPLLILFNNFRATIRILQLILN